MGSEKTILFDYPIRAVPVAYVRETQIFLSETESVGMNSKKVFRKIFLHRGFDFNDFAGVIWEVNA